MKKAFIGICEDGLFTTVINLCSAEAINDINVSNQTFESFHLSE